MSNHGTRWARRPALWGMAALAIALALAAACSDVYIPPINTETDDSLPDSSNAGAFLIVPATIEGDVLV